MQKICQFSGFLAGTNYAYELRRDVIDGGGGDGGGGGGVEVWSVHATIKVNHKFESRKQIFKFSKYENEFKRLNKDTFYNL